MENSQANQTMAPNGGGSVTINAQASAASGNQGGINVAGLEPLSCSTPAFEFRSLRRRERRGPALEEELQCGSEGAFAWEFVVESEGFEAVVAIAQIQDA